MKPKTAVVVIFGAKAIREILDVFGSSELSVGMKLATGTSVFPMSCS